MGPSPLPGRVGHPTGEGQNFAYSVLESISDGFAAMDADWRLLFINDPGLKILSPLGKTRENLLGRILWNEIPEILGTEIEQHSRRAMRDQVTVALELFCKPIQRWLFVRAYPSPRSLTIYFLDIHERKQQEQALIDLTARLAEQTEIFDTTLAHIDDFAYIFDLEGRFVFANNSLLSLWGRKLEDAVGKNFYDLHYPPELAARLQQEIQQVISTKTGITNLTAYTSPAGEEGFYEYIFRPVFATDGSVKLIAGSTRDITRHKQIEKALRESEARFRNLADNMAQFAWIADSHGAISWYNRRWFEYTGETMETMQGWGWQTVHHPDHVDRVTKKFKKYIQEGTDWEDVFPLRGSDGEFRWFLSRAYPVRDGSGRILSWFGTNTDITELRAAREAAERANHSKDDFLAALSHELRTPLNPVLLIASEAAGNADLPTEVRNDFATIARNAALEAQLIDDLLDLTRITHGKIALKLQPTDIHAIIRDVVETVTGEIEQKKIHLELKLPLRQAVIMGDAIRLQQVFWNIIRNAVKFTSPGGKVTISSQPISENKSVRIQISDNGIGMTTAEIGRLFNAFAQGDHSGPTGSHRFGGLGLGLAISHALVELHSGQITAQSDGPHTGSLFTVDLPISSKPSVPPFSEGRSDSPHFRTASSHRMRILLVEDHEPTRIALNQLLLRRHCEVATAGSLGEARELSRKATFDLLISDLGLPDGDGCALMEDMRNRYGLTGIALTGYGMEEDVERCKRAGFSTHLIKPLRIQALDEALSHMATRAGSTSP
jgi:PAS domain S-box-containing protein